MATKKPVKRSATRQTPKKSRHHENTLACAALLFAGGAVGVLGCVQDNDDIKLLLVGFSAALLVFGGALVGTMLQKANKR